MIPKKQNLFYYHARIGEVYLHQIDLINAIKHLTKAYENANSFSDIFVKSNVCYHLGETIQDIDISKAILFLEEAIKLDSSNKKAGKALQALRNIQNTEEKFSYESNEHIKLELVSLKNQTHSSYILSSSDYAQDIHYDVLEEKRLFNKLCQSHFLPF